MEIRAGVEKPGIQALPRVQDRMTFIYLEHCRISRDNGGFWHDGGYLTMPN